LELALIENIQRQNLNPIEEAFAYQRLIDEFSLTQDEVSKRVGKARPTVANMIRLLDLPEPIQKALADGKLSAGKAKALLSLKSADEQLSVFAEMIGERATVRDVERAVADRGGASRKGSPRRDPNVSAQERLLEERLGSTVTIASRGEKGTITISYYSKDEFNRLMRELT
jgi:ParB family chromosome partitioning protein